MTHSHSRLKEAGGGGGRGDGGTVLWGSLHSMTKTNKQKKIKKEEKNGKVGGRHQLGAFRTPQLHQCKQERGCKPTSPSDLSPIPILPIFPSTHPPPLLGGVTYDLCHCSWTVGGWAGRCRPSLSPLKGKRVCCIVLLLKIYGNLSRTKGYVWSEIERRVLGGIKLTANGNLICIVG